MKYIVEELAQYEVEAESQEEALEVFAASDARELPCLRRYREAYEAPDTCCVRER